MELITLHLIIMSPQEEALLLTYRAYEMPPDDYYLVTFFIRRK